MRKTKVYRCNQHSTRIDKRLSSIPIGCFFARRRYARIISTLPALTSVCRSRQTRHSKALSKTSFIVIFRECSRLCKVLEVAFWLLSRQYSNQKSKGASKEAESIAPSFFFLWNSCTRARSQAYTCTHALDQRDRACAAVGRAS